MQATVRLSREEYDGTTHNKIIDAVAARTGYDRQIVERALGAYYAALLEQSGGEPVVFEDLGVVLVPEGYPDVDFVVEERVAEDLGQADGT